MLDIFIKGGVVLWTIILLSVIALAIVIERYLYFKRIRTDEEKLFLRVKSAISKGHFDEAMAICDASPSPFSSLLKTGIEHRERSPYERKEVLKDTAAQEVPRLEKHIGALGTIAHISPLLGLLGTVTGNIRAFGVLGRFGSVGDPSILAKGISEALITTAAGLIVAIPATIFYNALTSRVNGLIVRMENQVNEMTLLLEGGEAEQ
ncbi:MAG: MotA/TolQ/ExbB proton channel family protein [Spirochaetaceae bacterium]|jgi:biopolymer transport protein ExbB|nr:MotA/TolQ/ExbB proton channel family protein [Spirochaetaceae bacterium]MDT8297895.1 MotA/TolQ/ExbB proton channel family protein [Spirochaetaceae bacterium]